MIPKDVITIQLGEAANYVGAHFWNIQVCVCVCFTSVAIKGEHDCWTEVASIDRRNQDFSV